jgi:hypothetical protein
MQIFSGRASDYRRRVRRSANLLGNAGIAAPVSCFSIVIVLRAHCTCPSGFLQGDRPRPSVQFFCDTRELLLKEMERAEHRLWESRTAFVFGLNDQRETGSLTVQSELIDRLFVCNENWITYTPIHDALLGLPVPAYIDVLLHILSQFLALSRLSSDRFPIDDLDMALFGHELIDAVDASTAQIALVCTRSHRKGKRRR